MKGGENMNNNLENKALAGEAFIKKEWIKPQVSELNITNTEASTSPAGADGGMYAS